MLWYSLVCQTLYLRMAITAQCFFMEATLSDIKSFNLSKYLDSIPIETLKRQYDDYRSLDIIRGFHSLGDIQNNDDELSYDNHVTNTLRERYNLQEWQTIVRMLGNKVSVIIVYAKIFDNKKRIVNYMQQYNFSEEMSWFSFRRFMLWGAVEFYRGSQVKD